MATQKVAQTVIPDDASMSDRLVEAIGNSGQLELMPEDETVEIPVVPVGPDNCIVPATLRFLRRSPKEGKPMRLLRILRPDTRLNRRHFARIDFSCAPFERYRDRGKPVFGHEQSCFVRNENDARDPLFDSLSLRERVRILAAFRPRNF